jgi:hypothetical protein
VHSTFCIKKKRVAKGNLRRTPKAWRYKKHDKRDTTTNMTRGTPTEKKPKLLAMSKPARKEYIKSASTSPIDSHLDTYRRRA